MNRTRTLVCAINGNARLYAERINAAYTAFDGRSSNGRVLLAVPKEEALAFAKQVLSLHNNE